MSEPPVRNHRVLRRNPLAACAAAILAVQAPALLANTITVTRCDDANIAGDLRHGVAGAHDGDTVDLSALSCPNSRISLLLGALTTDYNITLQGPGKQLQITSSDQFDRVLVHNGSGTLTIKDVTLSGGRTAGGFIQPGGCILSGGSVTLDHADAFLCSAYVGTGGAFGGAVFAYYDVNLSYSTLGLNKAKGDPNGNNAVGGGAVAASRDVNIDHSNIGFNYALGSQAGYGGAILASRNLTITGSTISLNAANTAGGIRVNQDASATTLITNSTISGNFATGGGGGGIVTGSSVVTIKNSTIALNAALNSAGGYAPGLTAKVPSDTVSSTINLQSTLIANNTYGPSIENDLGAVNGTSSLVSVNGTNNLVRVSTVSVPVGTITNVCPWLGPLRNNGGPTLTHALLSHSRGIDEGNNSAGFANDQRGPPFLRVSGGVADIGAYEVQQAEIVFNASFEGCP